MIKSAILLKYLALFKENYVPLHTENEVSY